MLIINKTEYVHRNREKVCIAWDGKSSDSTNKRAAARRGQPATATARPTAEPLMDCKSQWQGHKQESRRPKGATGDSRGKSNSRAPIERKSQWQGHKQESRRPKGATGDGHGKSNGRAPYGLQITMAGTQTREPPPEGEKLA